MWAWRRRRNNKGERRKTRRTTEKTSSGSNAALQILAAPNFTDEEDQKLLVDGRGLVPPMGLTPFSSNQRAAFAGTGYGSVCCRLCCGDFLPEGKEDFAFGLLTYRGVVSLITLRTSVQGNVKNPQFSGGCPAIFERCHKDTSIAGRLEVSQPDWLAALLCSFCAIVNNTVLFTIALKHDATCPQ